MGYYIETGTARNKADMILKQVEGSREIPTPTKWEPNLVCVVENGLFDAAGYAFDEREFEAFIYPDRGIQRPRRWLIVTNADKLSGYSKL